MLNFNIDNSFTRNLPADKNSSLLPHQVVNACYSWVKPKKLNSPKLIHKSDELVSELKVSDKNISSKDFLDIFSGNKEIPESRPYAMAYAGHQFGNWAGQLGDGRAINIGEIIVSGNRYSLQLKGAGKTPYSRSGDGMAVLRSSIREHLCSEAMHHLGIKTTRSLSLMLTGEDVLRDIFYDGHSAYEKGAVVCRVAQSFVRFGNFELLTAQSDYDNLKKLIDYCINYLYPEIKSHKYPYISFFELIAKNTLKTIIDWQRVGFVHGVMNTDNMSILGLTIDYGPYGWVDNYDLNWTPNTTDHSEKRYRFGNQANVALWNLWQLANALLPIIEDSKSLENILKESIASYQKEHLIMMNSKLGLEAGLVDTKFIDDLQKNMQDSEIDMTIFFRQLADFRYTNNKIDKTIVISQLKDSLYQPSSISNNLLDDWVNWFSNYRDKLKQQKVSPENRKTDMNLINPKYVLRNYMAQMAIDKAEEGDYSLISEIYDMLKKPYAEQIEYEKWFSKRPDWAKSKPGCSALSCSS